MDKQAQQQWEPLRTRIIRGETLTEQEQALYQAGMRQLEAEEEEALRPSIQQYQASRQLAEKQIAALERENRQLSERVEKLKRELVAQEQVSKKSQSVVAGIAE